MRRFKQRLLTTNHSVEVPNFRHSCEKRMTTLCCVSVRCWPANKENEKFISIKAPPSVCCHRKAPESSSELRVENSGEHAAAASQVRIELCCLYFSEIRPSHGGYLLAHKGYKIKRWQKYLNVSAYLGFKRLKTQTSKPKNRTFSSPKFSWYYEKNMSLANSRF